MTAKPAEATYDADDLTALEGLDAVRKRPGMYIGTTDTGGLTHMSAEIIDNAVDEALAGHCTRIEITFHPDGSVEVADNGRGIPTGINSRTGLSGVEVAYTLLHAGGKFGGNGYKSAGGLHGVGSSVVNALSQRTDVKVRREGKVHEVSFQRGKTGVFDGPGPAAKFKPVKGLRVTGKYTARQGTGTTVRFWPDPMIFLKDAVTDTDAIVNRARQTAFLVPGLTLSVKDARGGSIEEQSFKFDGGIVDMVEHLSPGGTKQVNDTIHFTGVGEFKETVPVLDEQGHMVSRDLTREVRVDVAFAWNTGYDSTVESFVNVVRTPLGGTHRKGFERAIAKVIVESIKNTRGLLKPKEDAPTIDDVLEGMTAVVSVQIPEPQFVGQTKQELGTKGALNAVGKVTEQHVKAWLDNRKTKAEAKTVLTKVVEAARVRQTQKQQKDQARRKTALEGASMPAKLVDCRSSDVNRSEVFVVEGDSALGTARRGRSSEYQALLPIRGKILNVQKASPSDAMKNAEIESIIQVLGAGMGRTFDIDAMRYGRVMLMADADVDGSHIRTLLLTLFLRYMRPVIESGRLYAAMPPLHKITTKGRNSETIYTYTEAEMQATVARLERSGKSVVTPVPRFKGLGEMNAEELWSTTMNPATRSVRRITIEDAQAAEAAVDLAMGSRVEPRRDWIIESADQVDLEAIDA